MAFTFNLKFRWNKDRKGQHSPNAFVSSHLDHSCSSCGHLDRIPVNFSTKADLHPSARYPPPAKAQATVSIMNIQQQDQSPLFKLPLELKLQIYELVLATDDGTAEVCHVSPPHHRSLLQTCRRILSEAEHVYYATNRFSLIPENRKLLRNIGFARRSAIKALTLRSSSGSEIFDVLHELQLLPNLRSFHIQREASVRYSSILDWMSLARRMRTKLGRMEVLEEVEIFTPEADRRLLPNDEWRWERLWEVDGMLERGKGLGVSARA